MLGSLVNKVRMMGLEKCLNRTTQFVYQEYDCVHISSDLHTYIRALLEIILIAAQGFTTVSSLDYNDINKRLAGTFC